MNNLSNRPQCKNFGQRIKKLLIKKAEETKKKYYENPNLCHNPNCEKILPYEKRKNKYCNRSCAAKINNLGRRRHGNPKNNCLICGELTSSSQQIYCSIKCASKAREIDEETKKLNNRLAQSRYRAKKYRVIDPNANKEKIKQIYENCPDGYEVDHIIPLSKGGKHHEDNLQYLTIEENRKKNNRLDWC